MQIEIKDCDSIWYLSFSQVSTSIHKPTFKNRATSGPRNHSLHLSITRGSHPLVALTTTRCDYQPFMVLANTTSGCLLQRVVPNHEWLWTTSGCEDHSWHIFFNCCYMDWYRNLGKRKVPLSFCLQALSFKLYLYNCEADPLTVHKRERQS